MSLPASIISLANTFIEKHSAFKISSANIAQNLGNNSYTVFLWPMLKSSFTKAQTQYPNDIANIITMMSHDSTDLYSYALQAMKLADGTLLDVQPIYWFGPVGYPAGLNANSMVTPPSITSAQLTTELLLPLCELVEATRLFLSAICTSHSNADYVTWFSSPDQVLPLIRFLTDFPIVSSPTPFPSIASFTNFITNLQMVFPWGSAGSFNYSIFFDTLYAQIYGQL